MSLTVFFQKIDHDLGAVTFGTELTRLGASVPDAELLGSVGDMAAGDELGVVDLGAELGARLTGAELPAI